MVSSRPCVVRPLIPVPRDAISLRLVEGFQQNSANVISMSVVIAEKFFRGQSSNVKVIARSRFFCVARYLRT